MSSGGPAAVPFPVRFADIVFADMLDPNGQNRKTRRAVVLTPDTNLTSGSPIVVAGVTGTLPNPLTSDYVLLPYKNPPGRHPKTGLTKKAAVLCTWITIIGPHEIKGRSGFVPPTAMSLVNSRTSVEARLVGGWPWGAGIEYEKS